VWGYQFRPLAVEFDADSEVDVEGVVQEVSVPEGFLYTRYQMRYAVCGMRYEVLRACLMPVHEACTRGIRT
jgi:hypothetical protein